MTVWIEFLGTFHEIILLFRFVVSLQLSVYRRRESRMNEESLAIAMAFFGLIVKRYRWFVSNLRQFELGYLSYY